MTFRGHIKDGQITLDEPAKLPEGAEVRVEVLAAPAQPTGAPSSSGKQPTIWEKLLSIAGTVQGLPADMAENHDHYLYGTPKRK